MSKDVFIYHHLGLGDHFHCNGVVRFLIQKKHLNKNIKLVSDEKLELDENNEKCNEKLNEEQK